MLSNKADDCRGKEGPNARSMGGPGDPGGVRGYIRSRGEHGERLCRQPRNDFQRSGGRDQHGDGDGRADAEPDRQPPGTLTRSKGGMAMRDTVAVAGWVGGAMLICVSLLVLCQHAEGERTRAALQAEQAHVDGRIRTLDARLTDIQADANRKRLARVANPPLDPKRLAKASKELDQLIARSPQPAA